MLPDMKTSGLKFDATPDSDTFSEQDLLGFASTSSLAFRTHEHVRSLQYVTYSLREQDNDLFTLIRKEHPFPTVKGDFKDLKYSLIEDVSECVFEYYNGEYNEFQKDWGVEKTQLPTAVRVTLTLGTKDEPHQYQLVIPLPHEDDL
jgi:hypothetical protein